MFFFLNCIFLLLFSYIESLATYIPSVGSGVVAILVVTGEVVAVVVITGEIVAVVGGIVVTTRITYMLMHTY